jgi:hypothetical protein
VFAFDRIRLRAFWEIVERYPSRDLGNFVARLDLTSLYRVARIERSEIRGHSNVLRRYWVMFDVDPDFAALNPGYDLDTNYSRVYLRRNAFATTLTEESDMAAAAMIGDSRMPNAGYSTPAAMGTPAAL